jgi:hypothetical protein
VDAIALILLIGSVVFSAVHWLKNQGKLFDVVLMVALFGTGLGATMSQILCCIQIEGVISVSYHVVFLPSTVITVTTQF